VGSVDFVMDGLYTPAPEQSVWVFWCARWNSTHQQLYRNGQLAATRVAFGGPATASGTIYLAGLDPTSCCGWSFEGGLGTMFLATAAMSPTEISRLYDNGQSGLLVLASSPFWVPRSFQLTAYRVLVFRFE
jgi:hypothetical protein